MSDAPPPALAWPRYAKRVESEWHSLLDSPEGEIESKIQEFLETHPCMVPGAQSMSGTSGHSAFPSALIKQPKLPGLSDKFPDFMWIAADSGTIYPVVVEIESPKKLWFTGNGAPRAEFTQAHNQLTEWRMWFDDPANQRLFLKQYGPPGQHRRLVPQYVLIYGRRAEFKEKLELAGKRQQLQRTEEYFMSFDRLHPIATSSEYVTAHCKKSGYQAVSIPATIELGPRLAHNYALISGKEEAVDKNPHISEERKRFLKERFGYWDSWAKIEDPGVCSLGDRE